MDIPNWATLVTELAFGTFIAIFVYKLQSKTENIRSAVTNQIKEYTEGKKKHDATRKKYYLDKIKDNLKYIKEQNQSAKNIINSFKKTRRLPDKSIWLDLVMKRHEIASMCKNDEVYLEHLEPYLTNPQTAEEIMAYLPVLYAPFEHWNESEFRVEAADSIIDIHLPEIEKYLDLLSKEEVVVTNPTP
jgi:hypothetical protein